MQIQNENKLKHLEGLRGIAALCVFFHHFGLAFYPSYYNAYLGSSHLHFYDVKYFYSPLSVFTNGNFMVTVFFVLSGYVLSRKYFLSGDVNVLFSAAQRRFFRLFIPVGFTVCVSFLFLRLSLYYNGPASVITKCDWWLVYLFGVDHSLATFLRQFFYRVMFLGDGSYDTTLWTMSMELFGSLLVFSSLALTHKSRIRIPAMLVLMFAMWLTDHYYYCAFVLGVLLNYSENIFSKLKTGLLQKTAVFILFFAGLLLGSFPSTEHNAGTIFNFLPLYFFHVENIHITGAFMLVAAVVCSPLLQKLFSNRIFVFLGKISFSLYLFHPILICSFSCFLFIHLTGYLNYNYAMLIVFPTTLLLLFISSWLMTKYIDEPGTEFSKTIFKKMKKDQA